MNEELKNFLIEFEQRTNQRFDNMDKKMEEMNRKIEESSKMLLDKQFLFEEEYGKKIDAIYDSVALELDKNLEKSQKIRKLDDRLDKTEVNIFDHEKRISYIERNR